MSIKIQTGNPTRIAALLILANAGCAQSPGVASIPVAATHPEDQQSAVPAAREWWRETGETTLAQLVTKGLESSPEITCRVSRLRRYDFEAARAEKRIGVKLSRLFGTDQKSLVDAQDSTREERVRRIAAGRADLARQIAFAYVEVRRLQEEVALRSGLRDQYKDNAEVAQFRREAGLVSAIDGALARSQDQAAQGELDFAQGRLGDAIFQLARLIGDTPESLTATLGTANPVADIASAPDIVPPGDARRVTLADAVLHEARLAQALEEARRTVRDARGAYRQGAGSFTTLYVAESAATAINLALVNARAARMKAALDLWSVSDVAWARRGLDKMVAAGPFAEEKTIIVTADCE